MLKFVVIGVVLQSFLTLAQEQFAQAGAPSIRSRIQSVQTVGGDDQTGLSLLTSLTKQRLPGGVVDRAQMIDHDLSRNADKFHSDHPWILTEDGVRCLCRKASAGQIEMPQPWGTPEDSASSEPMKCECSLPLSESSDEAQFNPWQLLPVKEYSCSFGAAQSAEAPSYFDTFIECKEN